MPATEWLGHIFDGVENGWISIFSIDATSGRRRVDWARADHPDTLETTVAKLAETSEVWFGCATRTNRLEGSLRGGKADCAQITALWNDIDIAGPNHKTEAALPASVEEAMSLIHAFPLKPTAVVHSGGGLQAWWKLAEPLDAVEAEPLLARWAATWGDYGTKAGWHVDNVFEVARVMRLPGTYNRKNTPTPVRIVEQDWERRYGIDDIDAWLIDPPTPARSELPRAPYIGPQRPGDAFNAAVSGNDILRSLGWLEDHTDTRTGDTHWVRPGKQKGKGSSATVYADDGHTTVYSDDTSLHTTPRRPYDPFGLYVALVHRGDFRAASAELNARGYGQKYVQLEDLIGDISRSPAAATAEEPPVESMFIDWATFWNTDHQAEEWIAYPLLPAHRQTAIYAPAKTGKSLLGLDVCLAVATGRPILGGGRVEAVHVMYLDYEMTEDDLKERILDLGYDEDDDLSRFHYALQPPIAPLDTVLGGAEVLAQAETVGARLVIVDTYGRAVQGDENDADTVRAFYRNTGMALKRAGIAMLRMDHAGKDIERGQRGSSAKNDDVDVIWRAVRSENGLTLTRTHSRVSWVPETVAIAIELEPVLRHLARDQRLYAAGTMECAADLDTLGVPLDASSRVAQQALKTIERGRKTKVICDALRFRRESSEALVGLASRPGSTPGSTQSAITEKQAGSNNPKTSLTSTGSSREAAGSTGKSRGCFPPLVRAEAPQTATQTPGDNDPDDLLAGYEPLG